jgi:UDP-2,3-diacylglucosamine hydrolase
MSETLFIADLHLDPKRPIVFKLCLDFLANQACQADALYILGDLFEVWVGDDDDTPTYQPIWAALHNLTTSGVPVFIMHGNRDFLLGDDFAAATGCQLIFEPYLLDLYGTPTLLMHGDSLCTLDTDYQAFRQQVRNPQWQTQFLTQPLAQRQQLAQQARAESMTKGQTTAEAIMDVTPEAVIATLETHHVSRLIHGHTHRAARHELDINGNRAYRWVVGEWREDSAIILRCQPDNWQLIDLVKEV